MFYRYEIKNNGLEDVLYLYLTMNYEFSKELSSKSDDSELRRRTTNFIKNNGIDFNGNKVYLVIDDIIVKTFKISKEESIPVISKKISYSDYDFMVTVQLEDNSFIEITLHEYLLGTLATNMIPNLPIDVLKAMAILYRTYAFKEMTEYKTISATNELATYKPIEYYKIAFAPDYDIIISRLEEAARQTNGMFLGFEGEYILPFIHISNYGLTLEDKRYPYLSSVNSSWDATSPFYVESVNFTYSFLSKVLNFIVTKDSTFKISEVSPYGKVLKLEIANKVIDGKIFMNMFHLKSQFFSIILNAKNLTIITKGWGDALGLSIFGASHLANNGCDFANILTYYFPKVSIYQYKKELSS